VFIQTGVVSCCVVAFVSTQQRADAGVSRYTVVLRCANVLCCVMSCCPPGARRLLRWEQRLKLHASSGQVVMPEELKVKLAVSAAELQQETGLSDQGLQYLLAVAGDR
jgi:hypothetical protein